MQSKEMHLLYRSRQRRMVLCMDGIELCPDCSPDMEGDNDNNDNNHDD